jgi:hypothetical protein
MTRLWILATRLYLILVIYYTVSGTAVSHPGQGGLGGLVSRLRDYILGLAGQRVSPGAPWPLRRGPD